MKEEDWDRQRKSMHFDLAYEGVPLCNLFIDPTGYESEVLSAEEREMPAENFAAEILAVVNSKETSEKGKLNGLP